jgi:hypothetical protein
MGINFLRGKLGDITNPILAAVGFNLKKYALQVLDKINKPFKKDGKKSKRKKRLHGTPFWAARCYKDCPSTT